MGWYIVAYLLRPGMTAVFAVFRLLTLLSWLTQAGVPVELWTEYAHVAACESNMQPTSVGDNGNAKGLMQIHWGVWYSWAVGEGLDIADQPDNPATNLRMAYLIQERYSLPRGYDRWDQWTAQPHWAVCQQRLVQYLMRE